jgi:hypothetical protein
MQQTTLAIGAVLVLAMSMGAGRASPNPSTDAAATSTPPVSGPEWCGFHNKAGDRVRCGYSSEADCKQGVGEPGAICIVDPYLTEDRPIFRRG